jgi:hypothetical protein
MKVSQTDKNKIDIVYISVCFSVYQCHNVYSLGYEKKVSLGVSS